MPVALQATDQRTSHRALAGRVTRATRTAAPAPCASRSRGLAIDALSRRGPAHSRDELDAQAPLVQRQLGSIHAGSIRPYVSDRPDALDPARHFVHRPRGIGIQCLDRSRDGTFRTAHAGRHRDASPDPNRSLRIGEAREQPSGNDGSVRAPVFEQEGRLIMHSRRQRLPRPPLLRGRYAVSRRACSEDDQCAYEPARQKGLDLHRPFQTKFS
jgi:hypothetical protein